MKATLELVDPLYNEVKSRARKEDKTFRAKVEELLRLGLKEEDKKPKKKHPPIRFPKGKGKPLIDLLDKDAMSRLDDEKFYREFAEK